ncbi:gluconokinase [Candidatus Neptunochlamydia vexilliferae]|uniref:Gluconokinase n=1 Tax=Candidatus Neptunichlamydia vexilliferae TaxID=1651774 RepID=A0ABS0B0Z8_9BACT|nr:gluconokinase [Candidatus Neptunochlamydia vexilliferae]MBF5060064.1 Thermoresistant gluconokinase [Candidatus Neptunochlamydia vexilliferae]
MRIVLIGVSGCGKTAVGKALATKLGIPFYDGDLFHPEANKEKMAHGIPLTDEDRRPFLEALAKLLKEESSLVLACSALKESYRKALRVAPDICFIYLKGSPELIRKRLEARKGHFFDPKLLDSQFEALKEPTDAIVVDASPPPVEEVVDQILKNI